jgi:electron transfer flavoprotein alpha subunit
LGNFLGSAGYDLVLAGRETGWADTGAVPLLLAEILGIPVITGAGEIAPCAGGVEVIRTSGAGRERLRARPPLLVTLGNGPVAALRTATLGERLAASGREAEKPVIAGSGGKAARITGESAGSVQAPRFRREERRKLCRFLQGGADLARSVAELRSEYLAVCRASAQNRIKNHESEFLYSANRRLTLVRGSPDNPQQAPGRPGTMTAAFVLPRMDFSTARLFEDLLAAVREAGDRTEFWLPGVSPNSPAKDLPPARPPIPEAFVRGPSDGGLAGEDGAKDWNIRHIESCLLRLETFYAKRRPGLILFPATPAGHELGVRLSARLNCDYFPETRALLREGNRLFARRKVCGSNLDRDAGIADFPAVLTVAVKKTTGGGRGPRIESPPAEPPDPPGWILEYEQSEAFPANPLETAPLIFAAGRGLGSRAACDRLRRVAGHFGAPLGFSRPAALNGWGEIAEIIGQSGLRTGAELCAAVGVSGAAAFMAGIEPASTLIAVNPDKNAPIFRYADIGIIAGAEEFIAALEGEKGV